jgi:hypothetical protein
MLSDLQIGTMTQRQKLISKEHQHAFEWILEEQKPNLDIKTR